MPGTDDMADIYGILGLHWLIMKVFPDKKNILFNEF